MRMLMDSISEIQTRDDIAILKARDSNLPSILWPVFQARLTLYDTFLDHRICQRRPSFKLPIHTSLRVRVQGRDIRIQITTSYEALAKRQYVKVNLPFFFLIIFN